MVRVEPRVVAPVTPSAPWREVPPTVVSVEPRVVAPEALRDPPKRADEVALIFPVISRLNPGLVFQIPIFDPLSKTTELVIPVPHTMNFVR